MSEATQLFKNWPYQEIFGHLMIQFDLTHARDECTSIPFQIIQWSGCNASSEMWNEEDTEINIIMNGEIIFEGVRHSDFAPSDNGYINYPDLKNLCLCLDRVYQLRLKYCSDYK